MRAVVYNTRAGSTKRYAEWFAAKTGLKCYSLDEAKTELTKEDEVIFFSWNLHAKIQEVDKAEKNHTIIAYGVLGMQPTGAMVKEIKDSNYIPDEIPLFTLIGRYFFDELTGFYRALMTMINKTSGRSLQKIPEEERSEVDKMMIHFLFEGGDHVAEPELDEMLRWYKTTYPSTATAFDAVPAPAAPAPEVAPVSEAPAAEPTPTPAAPFDPTLKPFIAGEE